MKGGFLWAPDYFSHAPCAFLLLLPCAQVLPDHTASLQLVCAGAASSAPPPRGVLESRPPRAAAGLGGNVSNIPPRGWSVVNLRTLVNLQKRNDPFEFWVHDHAKDGGRRLRASAMPGCAITAPKRCRSHSFALNTRLPPTVPWTARYDTDNWRPFQNAHTSTGE